MIKIVLTYGTFDLFHYGHYNLLKRAKDLGDYLIVGVSSDAMCIDKGKTPFLHQDKRMEIVGNLRFVDKVILEESMAQKVKDVSNFGANIFCLGSDYCETFPKMPEYKELVALGCEIVFFERTPDISSTKLREELSAQKENQK